MPTTKTQGMKELTTLIDDFITEIENGDERTQIAPTLDLAYYADKLYRYMKGDTILDICEECGVVNAACCICTNYGCMTVSGPL